MKESILHAIKLGYRHIDAASVYNSEQPLGEAITEALGLGLIKSREELFVTSKLWCSDAHPHLVLPALSKTLKLISLPTFQWNLGLEYLDLYLVHFPSVWEAMEVCHSLGLAKSIGVSNFSCKKLQDLLATAKIPPAVNQVSALEWLILCVSIFITLITVA
ncbi:NADPH-dependent codeinone reductase 1-2 [Vitis vinifera]|uniref:NADPH-dependent codeinone reductase 1-2 n=1 Tax=Vitis vinifera TaxID=29760 RepID=A0A438FJX8_VITVI|nr:NADPH-dependent codeinone reductase 1-2 [Vitis vinifera]